MRICRAQREDLTPWLDLAAEVEPLFGPMVEDPVFRRALSRTISRGTAYCIREGDGSAGSRLLAGLLLSPRPPVYRIGWLVVAKSHRRSGLGSASSSTSSARFRLLQSCRDHVRARSSGRRAGASVLCADGIHSAETVELGRAGPPPGVSPSDRGRGGRRPAAGCLCAGASRPPIDERSRPRTAPAGKRPSPSRLQSAGCSLG